MRKPAALVVLALALLLTLSILSGPGRRAGRLPAFHSGLALVGDPSRAHQEHGVGEDPREVRRAFSPEEDDREPDERKA